MLTAEQSVVKLNTKDVPHEVAPRIVVEALRQSALADAAIDLEYDPNYARPVYGIGTTAAF